MTMLRDITYPLRHVGAFFFLVQVLFIGTAAEQGFALPFEGGHKSDMTDVVGTSSEDVVELCRAISTTMLDERIKGLGGTHRIYFHWGFSESIPREYLNAAIDAALKKNSNLSRAEVQRLIIAEWQRRLNDVINLAEKVTGLPRTQAKGVAGILYYVHLLGDYSTRNPQGLRTLDFVINDLEKNLNRIFTNNSDTARALSAALRAAYDKSLSSQENAARLLAVLKTELAKALKEKRGALGTMQMAQYTMLKCSLVLLSSPTMNTMAQKCLVLNKRFDEIFGQNKNLKTAVGAGLVAMAFSTVGHGFRVLNGDEELGQAVLGVTKDTSLTGTATFISTGIMAKIEDKWVIVAKCPKLQAGIGGGVAVFIFDETHTISQFIMTDMTAEQFLLETGKNTSTALAAGTAAYCAVMLGAGPVGPVVFAVTIGAEVIVNQAWTQYEQQQERKYLFMEDLIGRMPLEVLNRRSYWNTSNWKRPDPSFEKELPFETKLPFESEMPFKAVYDWETDYGWK